MDKNKYERYSQKNNSDTGSKNLIPRYSDLYGNRQTNTGKCGRYDNKLYISSIICSQAEVSRCEAEAFCAVTRRLCCELQKSRKLPECLKIIDVMSNFFKASASKEESIAEVISSCKSNHQYHKKGGECC